MSQSEKEPDRRIFERAAELWVRMLANPKYDNLGPNSPESPDSIRQNTLASVLASRIPKNNTEDVLEKFRAILLENLTDENIQLRRRQSLHVDYHPDQILAEAANEAGLKMEFPWKTSMWITDAYISVRNGYAAESVYHYPLSNNDWLVTTLTGSDISKLIGFIENGVLPEFTIEQSTRK